MRPSLLDCLSSRHRLWMFLGREPWGLRLLQGYARVRQRDIGFASRRTDLIVEGYPRSGNTWAVAVLRTTQTRPLILAHHVHGPAQARLAARYGVPMVVIVRRPGDAVASLMVRDSCVRPVAAYQDYLAFHHAVTEAAVPKLFMSFESVIGKPLALLRLIDEAFNLGLDIPASADLDAIERTIEAMDARDKGTMSETSVSRPSAYRATLTRRARERIEQEVPESLRERADEVFDRLCPRPFLRASLGEPIRTP